MPLLRATLQEIFWLHYGFAHIKNLPRITRITRKRRKHLVVATSLIESPPRESITLIASRKTAATILSYVLATADQCSRVYRVLVEEEALLGGRATSQ